ncbi:MAG: VOC family protein [Bryobacteraceae bacterium]
MSDSKARLWPCCPGVSDYLFIEDADSLSADYAARGVEFTRELANMPWRSREFVVKDCDGRLLAFGANL